MKCENCRFLIDVGYEYNDCYCGAGVTEDDEYATDDGCTYHYKTLEKREREIDEAWDKAHEITGEDLKIFFGDRKAEAE